MLLSSIHINTITCSDPTSPILQLIQANHSRHHPILAQVEIQMIHLVLMAMMRVMTMTKMRRMLLSLVLYHRDDIDAMKRSLDIIDFVIHPS
jgi:hypothetical protein